MPELSVSSLYELCIAILIKHGVPMASAKIVVEEAITNELDGYPSHGVLRFADHVKAIQDGNIDPHALPTATKARFGWIVDANCGFGALAVKKITETINAQLNDNGITVVGLRNAGRVGRLAGIGQEIAKNGNIVLGFFNFRGAGKRVAPVGSQIPLLSTNPFLFACPRGENDAVVLDISTSVVAEGKIRSSMLKDEPVPSDSWLYDINGKPTTNASALYASPPAAILSPLGGLDAGHKGFGLAMMCEILAGILTGGEVANEVLGPGGNGAMFIGLRPDYFGQASAEFSQKVEAFAAYCESAPTAEGFAPIRVSGSKKSKVNQDILTIPQPVHDALLNLKGS